MAAAPDLAESAEDDDDDGNDEKIGEVDKVCPSESILEMCQMRSCI